MNISPFTPGPTVTLNAGAASSSVQLMGSGSTVEVQNAGATPIFVRLGGASVIAATTDYPILGGQSKLLTRDPSTQTNLSAITSAGTAITYATTGEGV